MGKAAARRDVEEKERKRNEMVVEKAWIGVNFIGGNRICCSSRSDTVLGYGEKVMG